MLLGNTMSAKLFEMPADFSGSVRLFPLPDLVMFPRNVQPLHIFEERYCEMLEDALKGDQLIAMATLLPKYQADYFSRPAVADEICIGRVAAHERNDKGTYNLLLMGLGRARIVEEVSPVRAFREARVDLLEDAYPDSGQTVQQTLGEELAASLESRTQGMEKLIREYRGGGIPLGALTDIVGYHLPIAVDVKLRLLGEPDVLQRARTLLAQLQGVPEPSGKPQQFPPDFSAN